MPADFLRLFPAKEVFILSNLDRVACSLDPAAGLNRNLDRQALRGARRNGDPAFEPSAQFPSGSVYGWGSNWAGGQLPLLLAAADESGSPTYYYTWQQAQADGAGRPAHLVEPSPPHH